MAITYTDDYKITTTFTRVFEYTWERGCGFRFPCDKDGNILFNEMFPEGVANAHKCLSGVDENLVDLGVETEEMHERLCHCGSKKPSFTLYDARGISVGRVCGSCEKKTKAKYRPEIFTDSSYDTYGERVEEEW